MLFPPFRKFPPFFKKKWCQFCWRERIMFFSQSSEPNFLYMCRSWILKGPSFRGIFSIGPSVHKQERNDYHQYAALAFMVKASNVAEGWENPQLSFKHDSQCWIWKLHTLHTNMSPFECSRATLAEGFVDAQLRCNRYQLFCGGFGGCSPWFLLSCWWDHCSNLAPVLWKIIAGPGMSSPFWSLIIWKDPWVMLGGGPQHIPGICSLFVLSWIRLYRQRKPVGIFT